MTEEIPIRVDASEFRDSVDNFVAAAEELADAAEQLGDAQVYLYEDGELARTVTAHELCDIEVDISFNQAGADS